MVPDRGPPVLAMTLLPVLQRFASFLVLIFAHVSAAAADTCTFEKGICPQWVSSSCSGSACFQARKVASMQLGPSYDHTSKNVDGWSAYAIKTTPNVWSETATLTRRAKGPFCFTGWYHQSGTQVSTAMFTLEDLKASVGSYFHHSRPDKYGRWQRVRYSEKRTGDYQITIQYDMERFAERGVFAVDDLTVDAKACTEPMDGSCDFDWGDSCGYDLGSDRYGKWQLQDRSVTQFFLPDYTTNTPFGGLLYLELKGNETTAMLTSPRLSGRRAKLCLDFRYLLPGNYWDQTAYLLHVFLQGSQEVSWTWPSSELSKGLWTTKEVSFKEDKDFTVIIQCAMRGPSSIKAYCAIDAIKLRDCQGKRAQNDSLCDFEDGWCSWNSVLSTYSRVSWMLGGGNVKTTLGRPFKDHTYGNRTGSYVFFSNHERTSGETGDLISEILSYSSRITQCAEFWYIISGENMELKVLTRDPKQKEVNNLPLWTQKGGFSSEWQMGRIAVPHRNQVIFRAIVGLQSKPAFVALDDIAIVHHDRCETLPKGSEALSATELLTCDFQASNFCKWSSLGSSIPKWRFRVSRPLNLGPVSYPTKKGNMAYLTGLELARSRGTAVLQSPIVGPQSQPACFSFWYHMFGGQGASLKLTLEKSPSTTSDKETVELFLQRDRALTDRWYYVQRTVSLDSIHNKMVFTISNTPSLREDGVVALGPLQLSRGECDVLTDGLGYCDFELDTCGWSADASWKRNRSDRPKGATDALSGPLNSMYALSAMQISAPKEEALLTSPKWSGQSQPQCLEFWYKHDGSVYPDLQVEVKTKEKSQVVWQAPSYPRNEWVLARTPISQNETFQVVFRAKFGGDITQFVSLDDVILRPEPCVPPAECDFNDGFCGYVNQFQGNFQWLVGTGRYERLLLQPAVPRAKDTPPFAYLDLTTKSSYVVAPVAKMAQKAPNKVVLRSPLFEITNNTTQLTLRYYRRGPDITTANVSITCYGKASDKAQPEVQSSVEMEEVLLWTTLDVPAKQGIGCQLAVSVTRGPGTNGTMAIASIKVTSSEPALKPEDTMDSPTRCTFENGTMCGWNPGGLSNQWSLNDPSKKLPEYPRFDHTLKAYTGRFVYAKHDVDYDWGTAVFKSPELDVNATDGACLSFWVFALHSSHVNLDVWSQNDRLYATSVRSSHQWEHIVVNFRRLERKYQLWISFFMKQALVALDDIEVKSGFCEQIDFCSWELGSSCRMYNAADGFSPWRIVNGSELGLPDHTTRNLTGRYMYLNTTAVDSHHPISRVFLSHRPPTKATCVTFWFSGSGSICRLNVYRFTKETAFRDPLVSVTTPVKQGQWIARRVLISSRNRWNLVFEGVATAGVNRDSAIMIDDIEFTEGECPTYEYCTFEDECLPWVVKENGQEAAFRVERAGHFKKLPRDHTTQTDDGYYLLFESPGTKGNKTSFTLREPLLYECVSFWYFLPKLQNSVVLYAQDEPISKGEGVWKRYEWQQTQLMFDQISAETATDTEGFVAIDDVLISGECSQNIRSTERFDCGNQSITIERVCDFVKDCANGDDERNCGSCNFKKDLCGWIGDGLLNRGTTAWRRQAVGEVKNSPTTTAYASRKGYYLLLSSNATRPSRRLGRAIIDSPIIRNTNKLCTITFWFNYIANGTSMDVDLVMRTGGFTFPVWTLSAMSDAPEEKTWREEEVVIGRYRSGINFYFNGIQTKPDMSLFAVDEIKYNYCALPEKEDNCTEMQFRCASRACVMNYDRCNYVDDCGDNSDEIDCGDHRLSCNFENSFCDWLPQAPADKTKKTWSLHRPSPFLLNSPTRDHTTGTPEGRFMMIRSSTTVNATVIGPTLDNSTFCAITFFYAMQGKSQPKLTLASRTTKGGPWRVWWKQTGPSQFFHFVGVSVPLSETVPYQVAFIGEHTVPNKNGYIAIDDVHFWDSCKTNLGAVLPLAPAPIKPAFTCGDKEFLCTGIKECILLSKVCDFKDDCSNGADESRCGSCDFTRDLCGLENEDPSARFGWNWTSVENGRKIKDFPKTDSLSDIKGAYAAFSLRNPEAPVNRMMKGLTTPPLGQIAHFCVVKFYVYVPNDPTALLMFGVRPRQVFDFKQSTLQFLGTVSGRKLKGQWTKMFVRVGNWDAGARFVYLTNTLGVSIDRIEYNMCHPDSQSEGVEAAETVTCSFSDPSNCGWFPERRDADTMWALNAASRDFRVFNWWPSDSDSHKGPYMYAQNSHFTISKAHLVSMKMSPTPDTGRCFTFWYNMWHPNVGNLSLLMRMNNVTNILWTRSSPQGKEWKQGQVQLHSDDLHQLIFEAVLLYGGGGLIAIDNLVLNDTSCASDKSGGCNFESDSCGWQLNNWERTSTSRSLKPTSDHTTQSPTGRFLLAKAPGGRMVSPQNWYDATQPMCFRFWYFLAGSSAENLKVTQVVNEDREVTLWTDAPYQDNGKQWRQASVNLPAYNKTPTIVFDATTSDAAGAIVAVDDISLGSALCPSPGSCSFEEDMCGWITKEMNSAQWYRHRGATALNTTGVKNDHTLGTDKGYYLLLDAADTASSASGSLQSEMLALGSSVCFSFYYCIKKNSGATLAVAFHDQTGSISDLPHTVQATAPSEWARLSIERSDLPDVFSVVITGRTARGRSDVLIDDIDVRSGKCPGTAGTTTTAEPGTKAPLQPTTPAAPQPVSTRTTTSTEPVPTETPVPGASETPETPASTETDSELVCHRGEFNCRDESTCIPSALLCDGVKDCPNGLDEKCGTAKQCQENEFFCASGSPSSCMPRALLCNGREDCAGGSDESLCRECPHHFCLNGGICGWTQKAPSPACDCRDGYHGRRCNLLRSTVPEASNLTSKESGSAAGIVTGIVVVLAIVLAAAVAVFVVNRKRRKAQNPPLFIDNPSYEESTS
ncbi:MAM and LDL-receptor class A domain-containing protein 1 isoform X3 [Rhipicephalus microplus]|uniref:MAM and LDL-receptor class A domain-containing protein 1 isoform X3 n=1 Tax=Rhipicephalus microplus TaxID=6941 RepID=UPI003F6B8939